MELAKAGHDVHIDQPEALITAVQDLLTAD